MRRLWAAAARGTGVAVIAVAAALWSALKAAVLAILYLTRGFILYPLFIALLGGLGVAAAFAVMGAWADALSALTVAGLSGLALAAYAAFAMRLDPRFFDKPRFRRRW